MSAIETLTEMKRAYIDGLREMADWLERHPEYVVTWNPVTINLFPADKDDLAEFVRAAGRSSKEWTNDWLIVSVAFGPHKIDANLSREQVCRRVVTGTKEIPAQPARVEEIVEWVCDEPSILAETTAA